YSLRAFSKTLGLAPSTVSEVLKGTKNLSAEAAMRVAQKLGLNVAETDYFALLVQFESVKSLEVRAQIAKRLEAIQPKRPVTDMSIDVFRTIADWYHLPILELTRLNGVHITPELAAERLGISVIEARAAIERL